ncbi:tRNA pseudouridine synthase A family protein [Trichomonas vaginalis G3]|uniref:tRNA pseudouridine synthase n=1 Tax=Trichomonas vaginalis (strain ATCC PRA-98 / G3) TaxID=412133 RepID=A2EY58_TRIV3|nr:mRNA pseudouridine synthesis [Trichomonas vaginalis G3]EAY02404.1 tRNA pseudouridine synthase A family protein [Trichomonas vaginalis G3]KAI5535523.1 mRNA pseudouridine synthesis [Trichomonas vaginalis G3]|eukprot:XP_001330657.1 tRNA pseudouridine synthase A family protein [Trichomonas vaginalis G3]
MSEPKPKTKKEFSWDQYHERQIALRIAYIGWNLKGFVLQNDTNETVEYHIFEALKRAKLIRNENECNYSLCGRTDAGVSGVGNVISVRVRSVCPTGLGSIPREGAKVQKEEMNYAQILNGILPPSIRVTGVAYVKPDFNARFDCATRGYRYFFHKFDKNIDLMKEAAEHLLGEHDYRAFCKFSPDSTKHCVRKIYKCEFGDAGGGVWYFEIVGSGFIWHQIRCIASILFAVGNGFEKPSITKELLNTAKYPGRPNYPIADPEPLVFWNAGYENIDWKIDEAVEKKMKTNFALQLIDAEMRAAVLRCFIDGDLQPPAAKKWCPVENLDQCKSVEAILAEYEREKGHKPVDAGDE